MPKGKKSKSKNKKKGGAAGDAAKPGAAAPAPAVVEDEPFVPPGVGEATPVRKDPAAASKQDAAAAQALERKKKRDNIKKVGTQQLAAFLAAAKCGNSLTCPLLCSRVSC